MRAFMLGVLLAAGPVAGCRGMATETLKPGASIVHVGDVPAGLPDDPATIVSAAVEGDSLALEVRYGGGCEEHGFALYASDAFMESEPVQVGVTLAHDAKGDPCRALLTRDLKFDLAPLREAYRRQYRRNGTIVLQLRSPGGGTEGAHSVRYSF